MSSPLQFLSIHSRNFVRQNPVGIVRRMAVIEKTRPWIEPAQAYEKNQLGLIDLFLNSLRFTWSVCLLADTVVLLRAHALLIRPTLDQPLSALLPDQLSLHFD